MKNKVKAFTLMELTVTMLVTALVVAISYSAYVLIIRTFQMYEMKQDETAALLQLDRLLRKDFSETRRITQATNGLDLNSPDRLINYTFTEEAVIRRAGISDTFKVKPANIKFYFECSLKQSQPEYSTESPLIDELSFDVTYQHDHVLCHYLKQYSSTDLFTTK
jgi:Tfp pilus assembly protein PilE